MTAAASLGLAPPSASAAPERTLEIPISASEPTRLWLRCNRAFSFFDAPAIASPYSPSAFTIP